MRVVWSRRALDHLEAIQDYIAQDSPAAAYQLALKVRERVLTLLPDHPLIGRSGRVSGTRELVITGTAYIVVYEISERIDVLVVLHGVREWSDEFGASEQWALTALPRGPRSTRAMRSRNPYRFPPMRVTIANALSLQGDSLI